MLSMIWSATDRVPAAEDPATDVRYLRTFFVVSVLPAPLSPEIRRLWLPPPVMREEKAVAAVA